MEVRSSRFRLWSRLSLSLLRILREVVKRAYALSLIAVIGYVSYGAVRYLLASLIVSPAAPTQITELPIRLDPQLLTTGRADWQALSAVPHARSPLAHYHRLDAWIQQDLGNGCTTSGCHAPLPHARHRQSRAFLNMHATSIHCGVCHMQAAGEPAKFTWYDINNGKASGPPPILLALGELLRLRSPDGSAWASDLEARQRVATHLEAAGGSSSNPSLRELAAHFSAVRPQNEAFDRLAAEAVAVLPGHFRGEYGRKLALADPSTHAPILAHPNTREAVEEFLRRRTTMSSDEQAQMLVSVHPLRRPQPIQCTDCHEAENGFISWTAVGYPPQRAADLVKPLLFQMIQRISEGEEFHMPAFLPGGNGPNPSSPSDRNER